MLQIEKARKLDISEEIYFDIIKKKTASLIAAACTIGAISTEATADQVRQMHRFGLNAGIAFQIKDDLFDYGFDNVGKPTGIDIKEKKLTLPLIHIMSHLPGRQKKEIRRMIKKDSDRKEVQKKIIQMVHQYGGIDYAGKIMNEYAQKALETLSEFPANEASDTLRKLVKFVVDRKN